MAMLRFPGPCPGEASGGCTALPPPNGGRRGLKVGIGRSGCSGEGAGWADSELTAADTACSGVAGCAGVSVGEGGAETADASRTGGRAGAFRGARKAREDSAGIAGWGGAAGLTAVSACAAGSPFRSLSRGTAPASGTRAAPGGAFPQRRRRSSRATSSSSELECVFFSCTPNSGSSSSMTPGLTSSSRASSLTLTLLIEKTA